MNHVDLFSGIGGFHLAGEMVWGDEFNTIVHVEIDPFCQKVLKKHWPDVPIHSDIRSYRYNGTTIDLLTGGPPCQRTSTLAAITGKRTGETLWPEMARIVKEIAPAWVLVEQPAGNKKWEAQVKMDLESFGYFTTRLERTAKFCGAPHARKRVFIIANTDSERLNKAAGLREAPKTIKESWPAPPRGTWRSTRTGNCGVDDGISNWSHRLKSLGNAIVPQVVVPIMEAIKHYE